MQRTGLSSRIALLFLLATLALPARAATPTPEATRRFDDYTAALEARLKQQHASPAGFCAGLTPEAMARARSGELIAEQLTPAPAQAHGAMLHHWRGTAFAPGATAVDVERLMRDYAAYPRVYAPQVVATRVLAHDGDHYQPLLRVRQHHVLTVVMDTAYDVAFAHLDAQHAFSQSRSTRVEEIDAAGKPGERELAPPDAHGYLWRLNTYWSWAEADGGVYLQIESISLTRDIPSGFGWLIGPFVQGVPRQSLEFTLNATRAALARNKEAHR